MSQIATDIVDIVEIIAGFVAAPFTGGASLLLSAAATSNLVTSSLAAEAATKAAEAAQTWTIQQGSTPPTKPGDPVTPATGGAGVGTNTPGATGPQTAPGPGDIMQERARAANLNQQAYEQQALEQILGLKEQELAAEGTITSTQAARGVRAGQGTAGIQLATQRQKGQHVIGAATSQIETLDKSQTEYNLATWNAQLLGVAETSAGIQANLQTDLSNIWLNSLTSTINYATGAISKFWNPAEGMSAMNYTYPGHSPAVGY